MPISSTPPDLRTKLLDILIERSVRRGEFTLASGAKSDLYVNCKLTALDPAAALLVGAVGWELIQQTAEEHDTRIDAVGGLTMGADPIALSIGIAAQLEDPGTRLQTFTVRKAAKEHGTKKLIEGNFAEGNTVVVIDDVITTGGSTLQAIDTLEAAGAKVAFVLALVDRQEGGRENIERRGYKVVSIFNRADVLGKAPHPAGLA